MLERICKYLVLLSCISFLSVSNSSNLVAQSLPTKGKGKVSMTLKKEELTHLRELLRIRKESDEIRLASYLSTHSLPRSWSGPNQRMVQFRRIDPTGMPEYYGQTNEGTAKTISSFALKPGGSTGLNLTGKDIRIGVWDGGLIFKDHSFFQDRVQNVETGNISSHSTHVTGTLGGNSTNDIYDGIATEANIQGYIWDNLEDDLISAVESGMLLSNHSYGILSGWTWDNSRNGWVWLGGEAFEEDARFGYYSFSCQMIDRVLAAAPYHLLVRSAGNDRNERGPGEGEPYFIENTEHTEPRQPDGGEDGYDCIGTVGVGKNVLTVGAVFDIANGYTQPSDVKMTDFSSWGPADDGRIKPDIVANGTNVFSAYYDGSQSPATNLVGGLSGTSMATPSVTGSLALLQEYYSQLSGGSYLKSASLKGLVIHTADEAGDNVGPDYRFGWGLMNTQKAAQVLENSVGADSDFFIEETLANGDTFEQLIFVPGDAPLTSTLCWTDPAGVPVSSGFLNNPKPMLVNDLDVRLIHAQTGQVYFPYFLNPDNPTQEAQQGDNSIDNVEKIFVSSSPRGAYFIQVSHKDNLQDLDQAFSLFISGLSALPQLADGEREALITLYEETGGENWTNSWDLEANPYTWYGVQVNDSGRVVALDLANNNLAGDFPTVALPQLTELLLNGNQIRSFSDSLLSQQLDQLDLRENRLSFTDLLPLLRINIPNFSFSPQDSLDWAENQTVRFGDSLVYRIDIDEDVPNLTYNWYWNDSLIQSGPINTFLLDFVRYSDSGLYHVELAHPEAPNFVLSGKKIRLFVEPPLCELTHSEILIPATCGNSNGEISLQLGGGRLPYRYSWNTGSTDSLIQNLEPGTYQVIWQDRNLCTDSLIFTLDSIPTPEIQLRELATSSCLQPGSAEVRIEGDTGPFEILWVHGPTTAMVEDLGAGWYQVQVTDSNACVINDSIQIQGIEGPNIQVSSFEEAHCGKNTGKIEIAVFGDSPPFQVSWENGLDTLLLDNLQVGTYQVWAQDSLGCRDTLTFDLPGSDTLKIDTVIVSDATCGEPNGQAEVIVTGGQTPYIFSWDHLRDSSTNVQSFLGPTFYTVFVSDQTGCTDSIQFSVLELGELPLANFSYQTEGNTVSFRDLSEHASSYRWEFGDGTWSILPNPEHSYSQLGNYEVKLVVGNELCGADTLIQEIEISALTSQQSILKPNDIRVYPSPANHKVHIDLSALPSQFSPKIWAINSLGNTISDFGNVPKGKYLISFTVENFPAGIYTLLIQVDSQTLTKKFFIK